MKKAFRVNNGVNKMTGHKNDQISIWQAGTEKRCEALPSIVLSLIENQFI